MNNKGNMKRLKTEYPGVFYREASRIGGNGTEKIYYVIFKKDGKLHEEKAGRQYADDMTAAKAARIRADRIEGRRESRKERREAEKAEKLAEAEKPTLSKLWKEYKGQNADSYPVKCDGFRFEKYLKPKYGDKMPAELHQLDVDRLRINLLKDKSPQTVKHVLGLLKRLCNFGVKKQLCQGVGFKIEMPKVDNQRTEDLTPDQLKSLLKAISESTDIQAAAFMKMALFTGMRRGELMKLKWEDVDFDRGFIFIREPKGGKSQRIPLNEQARVVLKNHPQTADYVFVRDKGLPFTNVINKRVRIIKKAAGLPDDFRPLHGLRHAFASILASSGQVDMYVLQKLLTHKSPQMTQRYAHLRDATLRQASALVGNLISEQTAKATKPTDNEEAVGA